MSENQLKICITDHILGFEEGRLTKEEMESNIKTDIKRFKRNK